MYTSFQERTSENHQGRGSGEWDVFLWALGFPMEYTSTFNSVPFLSRLYVSDFRGFGGYTGVERGGHSQSATAQPPSVTLRSGQRVGPTKRRQMTPEATVLSMIRDVEAESGRPRTLQRQPLLVSQVSAAWWCFVSSGRSILIILARPRNTADLLSVDSAVVPPSLYKVIAYY